MRRPWEWQGEHAGKEIHLLLADVIVPQMGGKALADKLKIEGSDIRTIFFSGYPEGAIAHHGLLASGIAFLQKPFSPAVLARRVREMLDG